MSGMILSMSIGTSVGLTFGILLGSIYQGNLFYSTLYSILGGILAGTICGLIYGVIPSLEGFMGGLMTLSKSSTPYQESHHLNHNEELLQKNKQQFKLTIHVQPSQFSYDPTKVIVKKGQNVSLTLKNEDSIDHDIEIKNIPFDVNGTENHQEHINKKGGFHLHAPARKQAKITFTPLKQGTYEFFCTIPGHKEKGMVGLLIIS